MPLILHDCCLMDGLKIDAITGLNFTANRQDSRRTKRYLLQFRNWRRGLKQVAYFMHQRVNQHKPKSQSGNVTVIEKRSRTRKTRIGAIQPCISENEKMSIVRIDGPGIPNMPIAGSLLYRFNSPPPRIAADPSSWVSIHNIPDAVRVARHFIESC